LTSRLGAALALGGYDRLREIALTYCFLLWQADALEAKLR
jgi:hypothetical protein